MTLSFSTGWRLAGLGALALLSACSQGEEGESANVRIVSPPGTSACAGEDAQAPTVVSPSARPALAAGGTSAIYFMLCPGVEADTLLKAETAIADATEIHETRTDASGRRAMVPMPSLAVAKATPLAFEPGGLHVMLIGVKAPLEADTTFELTLTFENAGKMSVRVPVHRNAPAGGSNGSSDHHRSGS
ncbi:MAG: copper chaperone PCu(A)C [Pseudomonadota bacterium]